MHRLNISYKQFYVPLNEIWLFESDPNAPSTWSEPGGKQWQRSIRGRRNWDVELGPCAVIRHLCAVAFVWETKRPQADNSRSLIDRQVSCFFFFFTPPPEKSSQVTKNPCFALNHLIYIFSIYILYIMTFFQRLRSVRLIRLEQRSLSVGKNFGLAKTLIYDHDILGVHCIPPLFRMVSTMRPNILAGINNCISYEL